MSRYFCEVCSKSFIHSGSLYNHKKRKHSQSHFQCDMCCFFCDSKFSLIRHKNRKHSGPPSDRTAVKCALCSESYLSKADVEEHYISHHKISITNEIKEFEYKDEFFAWKGKVEREQACEYIRKHSKYISRVDGTTKINFDCHRNGKFKSKSENKRRLKILGSNKIDGHCPAKIACSFHASGKITAIFCKDHVGHQPEIGRMRLSTSDRQTIANKIASNIPLEKILDDIRLSVNTSEIDRIHLVTRKDLLNIKQQYLKSKDRKRNIDCVESWIENMKEKLQNFIDKDETFKTHKARLVLQFLNVLDSVKTEEECKKLSKHFQSLLPTIETDHQFKLEFPSINSETSEPQNKYFSNKKMKLIKTPTSCEKDAIAAILLLEENNCLSHH